MANTPQSRKARGRKFQQEIRDLILEIFPELEPDDCRSTGMGQSGEDLQFSPAARKLLPIAPEMKNQEKLNVWEAIKQAEENGGEYEPVLFFRRNRTKPYAIIDAKVLLELYRRLHESNSDSV